MSFKHGIELLTQGHLREGFEYYELRTFPGNGAGTWHSLIPHPHWQGESLAGKTIMVFAEQGLGDVIQFCRFIPLLRAEGARVTLLVPDELKRLMQILDDVTVSTPSDPFAPLDYHLPIMSLPHVFRTSLATIPGAPYLRADPDPWANFLNALPGKKVGLVWAGAFRTVKLLRRSMRLDDLAPLLAVPGCSFVSLQLGQPPEQLRDLAPGAVHDVADRLLDLTDTAALICGLDLVIAIDTSIAHLAGALGKPVWIALTDTPDWRWMRERRDSPWYPTARLYRQSPGGGWANVVAEMARDLAQ